MSQSEVLEGRQVVEVCAVQAAVGEVLSLISRCRRCGTGGLINYCVNREYFSELGIVNVYNVAEDFTDARYIYHKSVRNSNEKNFRSGGMRAFKIKLNASLENLQKVGWMFAGSKWPSLSSTSFAGLSLIGRLSLYLLRRIKIQKPSTEDHEFEQNLPER